MTTKRKNPVGTNHPDYIATLDKWTRCRDACAGSDAIKAAGERYLPRLSAHTKGPTGEAKYQAYKKRALWYNASRRTRIGLSGAMTMKPPKISVADDAYMELAKEIAELRSRLIDEVLEVGRYALVVNQIGDGDPFVTFWCAESIVNWDYTTIDGEPALKLLVLEDEEVVSRPSIFERECSKARHVYFLSEGDGYCYYEKHVYNKNTDDWDTIVESTLLTAAGGRPLDHIPAIIADTMEVNGPISEPLLLDLVDVNISHYMNSADLEHGRHWTALPTAVASGFPTVDREGQPIEFAVGGENAWLTEIPGATASYLEFSGAGLGHLQQGMKDKQEQMAILGGRLLEAPKDTVESAETKKTRLAGERSVIARVGKAASAALTWALEEVIWFDDPFADVEDDTTSVSDDVVGGGAEDDAVGDAEDTADEEQDAADAADEEVDDVDDVEDAINAIVLDTDFMDEGLSPQMLTALSQALQAGSISFETFFAALQAVEFYPLDLDVETERANIAAGNPAGPKNPFAQQGGFGGTGGFP